MHSQGFALVLGVAWYLAAPATAQFVPSTTRQLQTPRHTVIYTTTLTRQQQQNPIQTATATVTLLVPREVGWPKDGTAVAGTPVTGTAISHMRGDSTLTWLETSQITWTVQVGDNLNKPTAVAAAGPAITAIFTDYSHQSTEIYGAWSSVHYDFSSTVVEKIVETLREGYPATMVQTGYSQIRVTATGGQIGGPATTFTEGGSMDMVRTTTLVRVG